MGDRSDWLREIGEGAIFLPPITTVHPKQELGEQTKRSRHPPRFAEGVGPYLFL